MNKKITLTALVLSTTLISTAALAHGRDRDGWRGHDEWRGHRHHVHHGWRPGPAHVVLVPPRPVYVQPPVSYYPQPVYAPAPVRYAPARAYYGGDRVAGQVVGAVAGGVIGNAVGHGGLAPTAVGAVVGGIIGGELAR